MTPGISTVIGDNAAWVRPGMSWRHELRDDGRVLATFRFAHWTWATVARGEFLGEAWSLEEHGLIPVRGVFLRGAGKSAPPAFEYVGGRGNTLRDSLGRGYSLRGKPLEDGYSVLDESGAVILTHRINPGSEAIGVQFGDAAAHERNLQWLILLAMYVHVRVHKMIVMNT